MSKNVIELWRELNVHHAEFEFSAGGDSMGDTNLVLYDKEGKAIEDSTELTDILSDEVYNNVSFYEVGDGHYLGEQGVVHITMNNEGDDLCFDKESSEEYSETYTTSLPMGDLLEDWVKSSILEKISSIYGDSGSPSRAEVNYKGDCVMTDKDEKALELFLKAICNKALALSLDDFPDANSDDYDSIEEMGDEIHFDYEGDELMCSFSINVYLTRKQ